MIVHLTLMYIILAWWSGLVSWLSQILASTWSSLLSTSRPKRMKPDVLLLWYNMTKDEIFLFFGPEWVAVECKKVQRFYPTFKKVFIFSYLLNTTCLHKIRNHSDLIGVANLQRSSCFLSFLYSLRKLTKFRKVPISAWSCWDQGENLFVGFVAQETHLP